MIQQEKNKNNIDARKSLKNQNNSNNSQNFQPIQKKWKKHQSKFAEKMNMTLKSTSTCYIFTYLFLHDLFIHFFYVFSYV